MLKLSCLFVGAAVKAFSADGGSQPFLGGWAIGIRDIISVVFFGIRVPSSLYSTGREETVSGELNRDWGRTNLLCSGHL